MKPHQIKIGATLSLLTLITSCGGGGASSSSQTPQNPTTTTTTTTTIQSNMITNYDNEKVVISAAIQGCFRGSGISGASIICSANAKQTSVQNFLTTVLSNIQAIKTTSPIDKPAISTMLSSYQFQDLAWLTANSLAPTYTMTLGEVAALAPTYTSSINTSYSNAFIQLNAM